MTVEVRHGLAIEVCIHQGLGLEWHQGLLLLLTVTRGGQLLRRDRLGELLLEHLAGLLRHRCRSVRVVTAHVVHRWLVDLVRLDLTTTLHHSLKSARLVSSYASAADLLQVDWCRHLIVTHLRAFLVNEVSLRMCKMLGGELCAHLQSSILL